jgi:hypothetical protein
MPLDTPKKRLNIYTIIFTLVPLYLFTENVPLMENVLENAAIVLKNKEQKNNDEKKENGKDHSIYFLSSIVYFDENHWTIWLNDEKILPEQKKYLNIDLNVRKNAIEIKFKGDDKDYFLLMPNQTICLKNGKICSGDGREKFEKEEKENVEGENFDF